MITIERFINGNTLAFYMDLEGINNSDDLLSLSDEELADFREKYNLESDMEFWNFFNQLDTGKDITGLSKNYSIKEYDPSLHDIVPLISHFGEIVVGDYDHDKFDHIFLVV